MSECNYSGCGHEGKIDGLCVKHHTLREKALERVAPDGPFPDKNIRGQVCSKCGKKATEVRLFIKKRGLCKDCAYNKKDVKNKKQIKKQKTIRRAIRALADNVTDQTANQSEIAKEIVADLINHPPHYTKGKIEVIDFIADQQMGYLDGNIIKYVARYRHKGSAVDDLKKAKWYLEKLIEQAEGVDISR
ncbi:DUF3310 domain-containing protein [Candidatus Gottesmanbacteria bacterium]|nr:DUF3310 domain-containing protein [Candidatus Gottesmanbacteria bacterium]